jgi:hypothetical protein
MTRRRAGLLLLAASACGGPAPSAVSGRVEAVEMAYLETRTLADQIDVTRARGASATLDGVPADSLLARYRRARAGLVALLELVDSTTLTSGDLAAVKTIRTVLASGLGEDPSPAVEDTASPAVDCGYDPAALLAGPEGARALAARIIACYGRVAQDISYQGRQLDRLTIFGLLGSTDDRAERQRLFMALEPVWRSVDGDGRPESPWRQLLRSRAQAWAAEGMPHISRARALGVPPDSVESWLEGILAAWRAAQPDTVLEPWDWYHYTGAASRRFAGRIPLDSLPVLNERWYGSLGADIHALRIHYDLLPRSGKYPVAYTTFGARPHRDREGWFPGEPWVFATYRVGGFDNLVELLHETGHGVHIAGIRTRPAFADWPDSDTFTEAVADLASLDAYEPRWQIRMLGDSIPLADGLRGKYGGVVLDMAWALFEIRMFRAPAGNPNQVWADITGRYLQIRPHPEWSWWAMRGQLIDGPGYMLNYALGAILTAQLRTRIAEDRGAWLGGDPGWYAAVRGRLFRFGNGRPSAEVVREFLGEPVAPDALRADLARGRSR